MDRHFADRHRLFMRTSGPDDRNAGSDAMVLHQDTMTDQLATVSGEVAELLGLEELRLGLLGVRPHNFPDILVKQDLPGSLNGGHGGGCRGRGGHVGSGPGGAGRRGTGQVGGDRGGWGRGSDAPSWLEALDGPHDRGVSSDAMIRRLYTEDVVNTDRFATVSGEVADLLGLEGTHLGVLGGRPGAIPSVLARQDLPDSLDVTSTATFRWDLHDEQLQGTRAPQTAIAPTTLRSTEATLLQFCRLRETPMPASVPGVQGIDTGPFCSCGVYVETSHEEQEEEPALAKATKAVDDAGESPLSLDKCAKGQRP